MPVESMIPPSRNDSSSLRKSVAPPNRKFSLTKRRMSALRSMVTCLVGVSNELLDENLRRQNTDQRHVVSGADDLHAVRFSYEVLYVIWVVEAVGCDSVGDYHVLHVDVTAQHAY